METVNSLDEAPMAYRNMENLLEVIGDTVEEVMLIKNSADLENFKAMYGIEEEIVKEY